MIQTQLNNTKEGVKKGRDMTSPIGNKYVLAVELINDCLVVSSVFKFSIKRKAASFFTGWNVSKIYPSGRIDTMYSVSFTT